MSFKMFCVEVGLGTMRARKLPIGVFGGYNGIFCRAWSGSSNRRSARSTGQNTSTALGANDVRGRLIMPGLVDTQTAFPAASENGVHVGQEAPMSLAVRVPGDWELVPEQ